jgi:hypothetical protein
VTFKLRYKIVLATIQNSYLSRRDTEEKKDDTKKPAPPASIGASQPAPSTDAKKEEKHQ